MAGVLSPLGRARGALEDIVGNGLATRSGGALAVGLIVGLLALSRHHFTFNTETDTLGIFVPEAMRALRGEPLLLGFHPPLYPLVLAGLYALTGSWLSGGLVISVLSAAVMAGCCFELFRRMAGEAAGWGSVVTLLVSPVFLTSASLATTDVFFTAMFSAALLAALVGYQTGRAAPFAACGLLLGCTILTRSNAFTLAVLALVPWLGRQPLRGRARRGALLLACAAVPLGAWAAMAALTGSNFLPQGNHANLALTYFSAGPDRQSSDAMRSVEGRFHSLWEVLRHDPATMARTYLHDLLRLPRLLLVDRPLLPLPVSLLVLPGLIVLLAAAGRALGFYALLVVVPQVLLLNLKDFEPRFYLFLLPLLGAALASSCALVLASARSRRYHLAMAALLGCVALTGCAAALRKTWPALHAADAELGSAIPFVARELPSGGPLITRKPHLCIYAGCREVHFPPAGTVEELGAALRLMPFPGAGHLYFGSAEKGFRPGLKALADPSAAPSWLKPVGGDSGGGWVLYRYEPEPAGG